MTYKYATKQQLKEFLDRRTWSKLDDAYKYLILRHMLHNDESVRVWIIIPGYGTNHVCGMMVPIAFFNNLATVEIEDSCLR